MACFVLVHGSWHDGSAWDAVIQNLCNKGHHAHNPTIAGHGKGVDKGVNHVQCTTSITDYIVDEGLTDIILVGHSFGGTVIAKVAERIPDRIKRLVFWNAFVVEDGNSLNDELPPHYRDLFAELASASRDNTVKMPFSIWHQAFINDADMDLARATYEQLSTEPYQPFIDKLDLKRFYSLNIPKSYLNCVDDIALPQGEWGWHPRMSNRLGLYRLVQMPGSHEALFTAPRTLADKLIEAGCE